MGVYATNKKVTLKATANKGYVFMGWYEDGELVSRLTSYVLTMPDYDVALEARFITDETDRAAISASVDNIYEFDSDNLEWNLRGYVGVSLELPVVVTALSEATFKVSGLPAGLKFTAKPIVTKTVTGTGANKNTTIVTNVPANTIYGIPTVASKADKNGNALPSVVKITVTTAGKSSQTFVINMTVQALAERFAGTFTGGSETDPAGSATLTVSATGKVSGKWISEGKTWTLSANGFKIGYCGAFYDTTLIAKCGKETQEIPISFCAGGGKASTKFFTVYWSNWKTEPEKTIGKAIANKKSTLYVAADGSISDMAFDSPYGTIALSMSANGTVKTVGSFITGKNQKTGKDVVCSVTGSATLVPDGDSIYRLIIYFQPKGDFDGYVKTVWLQWDGKTFALGEPTRADCEEHAIEIAECETIAVKLVNGYSPGMDEYYDSGICWIAFTAKRGHAYSVRVFDAEKWMYPVVGAYLGMVREDSNRYDIDLNFEEIDDEDSGTYFVLNADEWNDNCSDEVRCYIEISGEIGQEAKVSLLPYACEAHVVAFDANGGYCTEQKREIWTGSVVKSLPVPQRDGCRFIGWYTDATGGSSVSDDFEIWSDMTLYAHWIDIRYSIVRFDSNGGTGEIPDRTLVGGNPVGDLPIVERDGYAFCGWYTASDGGDRVTADTEISQDMTLFARWSYIGPTYLVIDLAGGTTAETYPILSLEAVPKGGWSDEYKSEKMLLKRIDAFEDGEWESSYYLGVFEVTQRQWELVMGSNPSTSLGNTIPVENVSYDMIRGNNTGRFYPVSSSVDPDSFMGILRARTQLDFDLPSEKQWTNACQYASVDTRDEMTLYQICWCWPYMAVGNIHCVGEKPANDLGLYDMLGNVGEWCLDWYGRRDQNATWGLSRVQRGGSWGHIWYDCTDLSREGGEPDMADKYTGLRVAVNLSQHKRITVHFDACGGNCSVQSIVIPADEELEELPVPSRNGFDFLGWFTYPFEGLEIFSGDIISFDSTLYAQWYDSENQFIVVDISNGTAAGSYAMTSLSSEPESGWSDEYKTSKIVLRLIEPGMYKMQGKNEMTISNAFYAGVFEVTQRQWELVMGNRPSYFSNDAYYATRPVEQVSLEDAELFMATLRNKTSINFSLPTEAQWEYACRAGTTTSFNTGTEKINSVGRYLYNGGSAGKGVSNSDASAGTAIVGSYASNAWGLYDMHGNVSEWCQNSVSRGGSWCWAQDYCTSASRLTDPWSNFPNYYNFKGGYGFRVFVNP